MRLLSGLITSILLIGFMVTVAVASPYITPYLGARQVGEGGIDEQARGDELSTPGDGETEERPGPGEPPNESENDGPSPSGDFQTVWESSMISFGPEEPTYLVIQTEEEWHALWRGTSALNVTPPTVDFETHTVLVAMLGSVRTTGYTIRITDVFPMEGGGYEVSVKTTSPGVRCITGPAFTYPVHMVSMPKSTGPFQFVVESEVIGCR